MQPQMCARCKKNIAVVFVTKYDGVEAKNEGLCLKCAKQLGIKPIDDMISKMGLNDEDLEELDEIGGAVIGIVRGVLLGMLAVWMLKFMGLLIGMDTLDSTILAKLFEKIGIISFFLGV